MTRKVINSSPRYKIQMHFKFSALFNIFFPLLILLSGNMTAAVNWSCMTLLIFIFLMLYMKSITPQFQYCHFLSPTFYDFQKSDNILRS